MVQCLQGVGKGAGRVRILRIGDSAKAKLERTLHLEEHLNLGLI